MAALRRSGHDVLYAAEALRSLTDREVLVVAARDGRIIVTDDKDFGDLVMNRAHGASGVILFRIDQRRSAVRCARLVNIVNEFGSILYSSFVVVRERSFRIRDAADASPVKRS